MSLLRLLFYKNLIMLVSLTMGYISTADAARYYVKSGAQGGNGSSWSAAFNDLQSALTAAQNSPGSDVIWVAKGTYKPSLQYAGGYSGTEDNLKTFKLPSDVTIYGGFAGSESRLDRRDCDAHMTILSGDLLGNDDNVGDPNNLLNLKSDNAWHVLTADGSTGVVLDGLTVRDGYAGGPDDGVIDAEFDLVSIAYAHSSGGGLLARSGASVTLRNMRFEYNASDSSNANILGTPQIGSPPIASGGGAVAAIDEGTLVTIAKSVFTHNRALKLGGNGGALSAKLEANFDVSSSDFQDNEANRIGGAIHGKNADQVNVTGSLFKNNSVKGAALLDESGGAIGVMNSSLSVALSFFDGNAASATAGGGAIFFHTTFDDGEAYVLKVDKSIFTDNTSGTFGGGAINIFATVPNPDSKATVTASYFRNNEAGNGGAIYIDSLPVKLTALRMVDNKAWLEGGAVFISGFSDNLFDITELSERALVDVSWSEFKGNTIIGVPIGSFPAAQLFDILAIIQGTINQQAPAHVYSMAPGGGGVAVVLGGRAEISWSAFIGNSAPGGYGGGLMVGGSKGESGTSILGMNQAFAKVSKTLFLQNSAGLGGDDTIELDSAGIGNGPNGVKLLCTDGSCQ